MKNKSVAAFLLIAALAAYAGRSAAQRSRDDSADPNNQDQTKSGTSSPGMMGQNMMGTMHGMMGNQQQMFALMEKLMASLKAIQDEKDPAALKSKLAEHQALLNQMHDQMTRQGAMMGNMSDMMTANSSMPCGGMNAQMVMGTVTAVLADSITVDAMRMGRMRGGRRPVTIALTPSTKYINDGVDTPVKDLKVGAQVVINITPNGDKTEATKIVSGRMFSHMNMHH